MGSLTKLVEIFGLTDVGAVREGNEDAFGHDASRGLAVLADGMGGLNAGEVASRLAVDEVLSRLTGASIEADVAAALVAANDKVFRLSRDQGAWHNMGTTLVVCAQNEAGEWVLGHVGDSRAYLLRDSELRQLTRDHSVVQEMLEQGMLTAQEARHAANRHIITRAIGLQAELECDVQTLSRRPGDLLLLCSDGLSDMIDDAHIAQILRDRESLEGAAAQLIASAYRGGGFDNITVVLMSV